MKHIRLLLVLSFPLLFACSEDSTSPEPYDINMVNSGYAKLWKISDITLNGNKITDAGYLDDYFLFDKFGGGIVIYGEINAGQSEILNIDKFQYEIGENGTQIKFSNIEYAEQPGLPAFVSLQVSDTKMQFNYDGTFNGVSGTAKITLVPVATANSNSVGNELALTNGNIKLWKYVQSVKNGETNIVPCYRDDMFLFAVNGLAIKIFGDTPCNTGNYNNDVFNWEFDSGEQNIILTNTADKWPDENGIISVPDKFNIKDLNENEFTFEINYKSNGNDNTEVITNASYIK